MLTLLFTLGSLALALEPPPPPPAPIAVPAPLTLTEHAQYKISFGILGQLGALSIDLAPGTIAHLTGRASGSLLGLGETKKGLDADFDARSLVAHRWTSFRITGGKTVTDFAQQPSVGQVAFLRRRSDKPERQDVLRRAAAVLDPLSFLMQVRVAPPSAPRTYDVIDGQGLWLIDLRPARVVPEGAGRALRVDGVARPIEWDGKVDADRSNHAFSLWLSDDAYHTPLRVVMPLAVGEVRAELTSLTRNGATLPGISAALTRGPLVEFIARPAHP